MVIGTPQSRKTKETMTHHCHHLLPSKNSKTPETVVSTDVSSCTSPDGSSLATPKPRNYNHTRKKTTKKQNKVTLPPERNDSDAESIGDFVASEDFRGLFITATYSPIQSSSSSSLPQQQEHYYQDLHEQHEQQRQQHQLKPSLSNNNKENKLPTPSCCRVCGIEEEFVPEGMKYCTICHKTSYCSMECLEWDWQFGTHKRTCSNYNRHHSQDVTESSSKHTTTHYDTEDDGDNHSIDFTSTHNDEEDDITASRRKIIASGKPAKIVPASAPRRCKICGVTGCEQSCPKCHRVFYCSKECQQWHWWDGNHRNTCKVMKKKKKKKSKKVEARK